jgi:nucleotide-binding universal stress UspA family protein
VLTVKRILFPYDFSAQANQAAPFVRALADRLHASVTLLSVVPPAWEPPPAGMPPLAGNEPPEWKKALQEQLNGVLLEEFHGLDVERIAEAGDPAIRIVRCAEARQADLVMMPTHGLGVFRALLVGSVTSKVLHDAKCAVWTAAHTDAQVAEPLPRTIVCAVDGTPASASFLRWVSDFSQRLDARLSLVHVVEPVSDWPSLERERRLQEQVRQSHEAHIKRMEEAAGVTAPFRVVVGEPTQAIAETAAQEHADLVIIGRGTLAEPFGRLRTHAFGIVQRSPCPVLSI